MRRPRRRAGGRTARPAEIACAAVFIIPGATPFMVAACLVLDGGLSMLQHGPTGCILGTGETRTRAGGKTA
ncbi:hypothetical protein SAMN05421538_10776 [Paracoccus isoporae]|uniref:Uncharacterized protein n=1 Tax=Paracoccus isoporae TaxID=591205 RepID=A0A1G7DE55_9RHOB|nr:hypothetical protein SAMN05421538_10776 [Paracoccus isoporae]